MVNPSIVKYIKDTLSAGYTEAQIRSALIKQGWYPEEVDEALSAVRSEATGVPKATVTTGVPAKPSAAADKAQDAGKAKPAPGIFKGSFIMALAGGAVIIINSVLVFLQVGDALSLFITNVNLSLLGVMGITMSEFDSFIINIVIGGFLAGTSYVLYSMPENSRLTGIFIIALSLIAVMVGNGFLIGGVLAIIGGVLAVLGR
jgi:hypothetical protein